MTDKKPLLKDRNLYIIFSVTLMAVMGVSSITPAFPKISRELDISSNQVGYLISVFTLPGIVLTPVLGVMTDRLGRKKILVPALFLFGIAGFLCFFTRDFTALLIFRFFQGMGAASIGSINVTLIGDIYSGNRRSSAMGYNASVLSIGTAAYPAIGGAFASIDWYYPFLLPLLAIPVGLYIVFSLKNPEPTNHKNLKEYLGKAFRNILKLKVITVFLGSITFFIIIYGAFLTYFPFLLEEKFGSPVFIIGFVMSGTSLAAGISATQLGKLTKRFNYRTLLIFSFGLYIVSLVSVPFVSQLGYILIPAGILGLANGLTMPIMQTIMTGLAPFEYRGAFMSVNGMVLRIGQTIGPLYTGMFYSFASLKGAFFSPIIPVLIMIVLVYIAFQE